MHIQEIFRGLGPGIWTDRIVDLRRAIADHQVTKQERKWLRDEIAKSIEQEKRGRICNLLILSSILDPIRTSDWIRRSGALRASAYHYRPATPQFLTEALANVADQLGYSPDFHSYLSSVQALLHVAEPVSQLNESVVQRLFKDRNAIKGLLVSLDITFLIREEFQKLEFEGFTPEELAEGFSYLLFLYSNRVGLARADIGELNLKHVTTDHYFELIKDALLVRRYARCEILLDYFGYSCSFDSTRRSALLNAPSPRFAKALCHGFVHSFHQRIALADKIDTHDVESIRNTGKALNNLLTSRGLIKLKDRPVRRWVVEFPGPDGLRTLLHPHKYFAEELSWVSQLGKDLFVSIKELEDFTIDGLKIGTLVRAQRYMNLMRFAIAPLFARELKAMLEPWHNHSSQCSTGTT